jgi:hypothetical protein
LPVPSVTNCLSPSARPERPSGCDLAKAFAGRLDGPDPIAQAYGLPLQRPPTAAERAAAEKRLAQHGKTAYCRALLNSNALILAE